VSQPCPGGQFSKGQFSQGQFSQGQRPSQDEAVARATLTYLAEPGDARLARLVADRGAIAAVEAIRAGWSPDHGEPGTLWDGGDDARRAAVRRAVERWRTRLADVPDPVDLAGLRERGIRIVCPADPEWPSGLASLGDERPYALWVRGSVRDLAAACQQSVAIVGSRAATAYGGYVAAELAASVAAAGWTVTSGGAYGIDGAAHRGALAGRGTSIAVMACGVDRSYPAGHEELLDDVAAAGAVISEWPPGRSPTRLRFLVRNRVIAAMTAGTVVIEAGQRSGALSTARHARDLGRILMAVPGPVTSDLSAGCHAIIRDWQAILVTSAPEVIEGLTGVRPGHAAVSPRRRPVPDDVPVARAPRDQVTIADRERAALDGDAAAVLDALPARGSLSTDEIAVRAGLHPRIVLGALAMLRVHGLAERVDGGWRLGPRR
jgi:DNA processing protein